MDMEKEKVKEKDKAAKKRVREENPQRLRVIWREVGKKQRGLMMAMIALAVMSVVLLGISLAALRPQNTVVIVGYGDVYGEITGISGGYRRSSWLNMFAFPILAVIYGIGHNLLALRVYRKHGKDAALVLVGATMVLVVVTALVMFRLMGEW